MQLAGIGVVLAQWAILRVKTPGIRASGH